MRGGWASAWGGEDGRAPEHSGSWFKSGLTRSWCHRGRPRAPPHFPASKPPEELTDGTSQINWETTEDLAGRVVAILRHDGGPLRARDILTILQETGTSFVSENPVYSVVGALKVARENGWVVKKGRGWWQAASQVPVDPCASADGGESVARSEEDDDQGSDE